MHLFNPETKYFIIDTHNAKYVQSNLYGYCIAGDTVVASYDHMNGLKPDGNGSYVLIEKEGDHLTITQDNLGSHGLFMFESGDYWALSNNFHYLADHVKGDYPLTFNKDYADAYILEPMCSHVYGETMIQEIKWLDRFATVSVDILKGYVSVDTHMRAEKIIPIDSEEGLLQLDMWHDKWVNIIAGLSKKWEGQIMTDLSGGMDSRMVISLFLDKSIDLSHITVHSVQDSKRNHKEDYKIASLIADACGFKLNQHSGNYAKQYFSVHDVVSHFAYQALGFHKQIKSAFLARNPILIHFSGHGGEAVRNIFGEEIGAYIEHHYRNLARKILRGKADCCFDGANAILKRSIEGLEKLVDDSGRRYDRDVQSLYMESSSRIHCGEAARVISSIHLQPLLDPMLLELNEGRNNNNQNLLTAIILTRYEADLTSFPIEGNRHIANETVEYARKLNALYPYEIKNHPEDITISHHSYFDPIGGSEELWQTDMNQTSPTIKECEDIFNRAFLSPSVHSLFSSVYPDSLYRAIRRAYIYKSWHPYSDRQATLAIAKAIYDTRVYSVGQEGMRTEEFIVSCADEIPVNKYSITKKAAALEMRRPPKVRLLLQRGIAGVFLCS